MEKREYKKCPECDKSVKYLVSHMKNKHKLRTADFKDKMKKLKVETQPIYPLSPDTVKMDQDGEEKHGTENDSDIGLESVIIQRFDQLAWIGALRMMDNAIRKTYESLEVNMLKQCLMEGEKISERYDPAVVKYDVAMKRIRDTLKSSCDHLHREVICEMEKLEDQLKVDLSMMSGLLL